MISIPVKGAIEKVTVNAVGGVVQKVSDSVDVANASSGSSGNRGSATSNASTSDLSEMNVEGAARSRFGFNRNQRNSGIHGGDSTERVAKEVNDILNEGDRKSRKEKPVTFEQLAREEESRKVQKEVKELLGDSDKPDKNKKD